MQTKKEALLAILRGEKADFIPNMYEVMADVVYPGERYIDLKNFDPYGTGADAWGVLWTNQGPNPAVDGNMVAKDFILFDNIEDWKEKVKFPNFNKFLLRIIMKNMKKGMGVNPKEQVVASLLLSGTFERMNQMIGFEEALCAFYESPEATKEFFEAMCEYKLACIEKMHKVLKPDVIHMHDDWGTEKNMFFSPEIWREFIKPIEKRYADRIHELGMLYVHHSCGFIEQIIPDLIEIGVDAIEPVMMCNNIEKLLKEYGTQITFCGGIDNRVIDDEGSTEEQIRAEVRRAIDTYAPMGRYIPYYIPTNTEKFMIYQDECSKYGYNYKL